MDPNQRVNDGNMRESPGKDFYLQIMVNPRYISYIKHIKSIQNKGICLNLIYFIKTPEWRRRVAPPILWGSRNKIMSGFLLRNVFVSLSKIYMYTCICFLVQLYLLSCQEYICFIVQNIFVFFLQQIFVLLSCIYLLSWKKIYLSYCPEYISREYRQ